MFEQDRYTDDQRNKGLFCGEDGPSSGTSRFQVSGENDPAEIQAEQMADSIVGGGGLFRSPEGSGGSGFQADLNTSDLADGGESLPAGLQGAMEQSFGTGFSGVRVHTGAGADRASRSISARAFTQGQDVYFRSGAYDPDSQEGQHLIAHELAHVAAGDGGIHRDPKPTTGLSRAEILRTGMRNAADFSKDDLKKAKELIGSCPSKDSLLNEVGLGTLGEKDLNRRADQAKDTASRLNGWMGDLKRLMGDYVAEVGNEESAKGNASYEKAEAALTELEAAKKALEETVTPAIKEALDAVTQKSAPDGSGFPETVAHMMDDAACGQFFKAVEQVRSGAASADNFDNLNQSAVDNAANLHEDVKESGAEKGSRIAGNVGAAAGAASSATDLVSGGLDISSAAKEKKNKEPGKHEKNSSTAFSGLGAMAGTVGTAADVVGMGADIKSLHDQESARKQKIQEMQSRNADTGIGKASAADHAGRAAVAGSALGVLGGAAGVVSSVAGAADNDNVSDIAGVTSASLGAAGDVMGLALDSQNAKEKKAKDEEAKRNMRALGKQLQATLPTNGSLSEKDTEISLICERLKGDKFNAKGGDQLGAMITKALTGLENPKQKNLLVTLQALETSRAANKGEMSKARKDALFSTIGLVGSLTSLAGSIASMAGSGLVGSILSMVGSVIGLVGMFKDAAGLSEKAADQQKERNDERDAKVNACKVAVGQMAALPALSLDDLKEKRGQKQPLSEGQQAAAEQYASVFNLLETADVNMVDFLYAVDQGGFGGKKDDGTNRSAGESLKAMYEKLDFS